MADRTSTPRQGERKRKKRSLGVLVNARSACRLVELGQRRSGEVAFFPVASVCCCLYVKDYMQVCLFPYNGVFCPLLSGVHFNPTPYSGDFRLECSY